MRVVSQLEPGSGAFYESDICTEVRLFNNMELKLSLLVEEKGDKLIISIKEWKER